MEPTNEYEPARTTRYVPSVGRTLFRSSVHSTRGASDAHPATTETTTVSAMTDTSSDRRAVHVGRIAHGSTFRTGTAVIVAVALVWRFWTLSQWSWYQDDWFYMSQAAQTPFWEYVTQNYNGHIMPLQFALVWVMTNIAPLDFSWAMGLNLFFMTASILAWALALREMFGERARLLYPLAILALSPLFMPIALWWAAALQVFPLATFMGLSVWFVARYVIRRERRDFVLVLVVLVVSLLFWQKAVLVVIPIFFVGLMLSQGRLLQRIKSLGGLYVCLAVTIACYVPVYLYLTRDGDASNTKLLQHRGVVESISFYVAGLLDVVLPSFLGGPWTAVDNPAQRFDASSGVRTLFFVVLAVVGTVIVVKCRRDAWIPIAMAVTYAVVAWGLVFTSTRYDILGLYIVRDARYAADIVPVALLALAFLTTPTRLEQDPWKASPVAPKWRPLVRPIAVLALGIVVTSMVFTNGRSWDQASQQTPKPWVDNLVSDARKAGPISIYNTVAPNNVIFSAIFAEDARLSQLLKPLHGPLRFNQPAEKMYMTEWTGRLKEVDVKDATRSVQPGPVKDCGYVVQPGFESIIPFQIPLFDWEWGFQLDYYSAEKAEMTVQTENETIVVPLEAGLHERQFVLEDPVPFLRVNVSSDSGTVCVTDIRVGPFTSSDRGLPAE